MNKSLDPIILLIFYLIAYGGLIKTLFDLYVNGLAKNWPQVEVTILNSDIEELQQSNESSSYVVNVHYSYQYKGHNYRSTRIAFGYWSNQLLKAALVLLRKFETGKTVKAYINPKKPRISVLIAGVRYFHLLNTGFFIAMAFFIHYVRSNMA